MPELLRIKAEVLQRAGDGDGAIATLEQALSIAGEQGAWSWQLRTAVDLATLLAAADRSVEASERLAAILAEAPVRENTPDAHRARALQQRLRPDAVRKRA